MTQVGSNASIDIVEDIGIVMQVKLDLHRLEVSFVTRLDGVSRLTKIVTNPERISNYVPMFGLTTDAKELQMQLMDYVRYTNESHGRNITQDIMEPGDVIVGDHGNIILELLYGTRVSIEFTRPNGVDVNLVCMQTDNTEAFLYCAHMLARFSVVKTLDIDIL